MCIGTPSISVVMPIFNQVTTVQEVLRCLLDSMESVYEIIIIDDASNDGTIEAILDFQKDFEKYVNLKKISLFRNCKSKFETRCDTIAIELASAQYCIELQADMFLKDPGFDVRLVEALESDDSLILLSGRGVELLLPIYEEYKKTLGTDRARAKNISEYLVQRLGYQLKRIAKIVLREKNKISNLNPSRDQVSFTEISDEDFLIKGIAGRVGVELQRVVRAECLERKIHYGQTVMRGPLVFDKAKFLSIGGLNTRGFFQGFDDHDICVRAYLSGYKVGYTPVIFDSPSELGTTRKSRSLFTELQILYNTIRIQKSNTALGSINLKVWSNYEIFLDVRKF